MMPSSILCALDAAVSNGPRDFDLSRAKDHADKSELLRRILGLDNMGSLTVFQRARSMSGIGSMMRRPATDQPPGLGNFDNSCYQNSVIQGFASLPSLDRYLAEVMRTSHTGSKKTMQSALRNIIQKLNDPKNYGLRIWTPSELKSMSSWQQQDAQEYFSKVADEMDQEVRRAHKEASTNDLRQIKALEATKLTESLTSEKYPKSFQNPLEGQIAQRVGCVRCGYSEGLSLTPFNCLTVPLGRKWEYDIRDCLDEYTKLEPIEGVECTKCTLLELNRQLSQLHSKVSDVQKQALQGRMQAVSEALANEDFSESMLKKCSLPKKRVTSTKSRQAVVARPPKSLVIHVNRSLFDERTFMLSKNYADVRFPKTLDLGEWCLGSFFTSEQDEPVEKWCLDPTRSMLPPVEDQSRIYQRRYQIRAVIQHYGRHENGHYIAFRKFPEPYSPSPVEDSSSLDGGEKKLVERWWRLSDDDVSRVSEKEVLDNSGVFMLFYEAIDEPAMVPNRDTASVQAVTASEKDEQAIKSSTTDTISKSDFSEDKDELRKTPAAQDIAADEIALVKNPAQNTESSLVPDHTSNDVDRADAGILDKPKSRKKTSSAFLVDTTRSEDQLKHQRPSVTTLESHQDQSTDNSTIGTIHEAIGAKKDPSSLSAGNVGESSQASQDPTPDSRKPGNLISSDQPHRPIDPSTSHDVARAKESHRTSSPPPPTPKNRVIAPPLRTSSQQNTPTQERRRRKVSSSLSSVPAH